MALIIICIALVIAAELINPAIENLIDHLHPEIGKVKDIMAGMVLVLSFTEIIIALFTVLDTVGV